MPTISEVAQNIYDQRANWLREAQLEATSRAATFSSNDDVLSWISSFIVDKVKSELAQHGYTLQDIYDDNASRRLFERSSTLMPALLHLQKVYKVAELIYQNYGGEILAAANAAARKPVSEGGLGRKLLLSPEENQAEFQRFYNPVIENVLAKKHITLNDIIQNDKARELFYKSSTLTNTLFIALATSSPPPQSDVTSQSNQGNAQYLAQWMKQLSDRFFEMASKKEARFRELSITGDQYSAPKLHADFIQAYLNIHGISAEDVQTILQQSNLRDDRLNTALSAIIIPLSAAASAEATTAPVVVDANLVRQTQYASGLVSNDQRSRWLRDSIRSAASLPIAVAVASQRFQGSGSGHAAAVVSASQIFRGSSNNGNASASVPPLPPRSPTTKFS